MNDFNRCSLLRSFAPSPTRARAQSVLSIRTAAAAAHNTHEGRPIVAAAVALDIV